MTVCHKYHFVDPITGVCTNGIEGLWSRFRAFLPRTGAKDKFIDDFIANFMFHSSKNYTFKKFVKEIMNTLPTVDKGDDDESSDADEDDDSMTPLVDDTDSDSSSSSFGAGDGLSASEYEDS
ncbi:uncharacterized protein MONOS_5381 [Monocercomonoides exilis]|uniref:uncharacterized protein n=1 Tax=Monocercomonoides exilis TaxID=2049356 RepID=UPI00355A0977|nr:hypothetical protein MONOS_5381 [Monocercomonoides exilis]|eukprot:MONOS_5381.1-p1 / transcript=MONOS_5381.1 / gene=MONOS_5381 / organism=Monocercomonoides_exilis_PA203 / gene_product=unspecified product / transcript_product=unspecified product / location=Mono_scaffold00155:103145-103510(-) / protein_length=122 / sequence_SO=supercontig / SO=protein_coding / is_pseudo=false